MLRASVIASAALVVYLGYMTLAQAGKPSEPLSGPHRAICAGYVSYPRTDICKGHAIIIATKQDLGIYQPHGIGIPKG